MRTALRIALLGLAFALATWVIGWWAVPMLGLVWGWVARRTPRPVVTAGAAAALGWALLLIWIGLQGPVWSVAQRVGPILSLSGWLLVALTFIFPGVLAGAAAGVGSGIGGRGP